MKNYKEDYKEKVRDLTTELVLNLTSIEGEIIKEYEDENLVYRFKKGYKDLFKVEIVAGVSVTVTVYKNKDESLSILLTREDENVIDFLNILESKYRSQDLKPTIKNIDDMINILALNLLN